MFEKFKDMSNLVKQAGAMKSEMKKVQEELKSIRVSGTADGGKIEVVLTGELECVSVTIDPSHSVNLTKNLQTAFNEASKKAKNVATEKLTKISGGLNLPGM